MPLIRPNSEDPEPSPDPPDAQVAPVKLEVLGNPLPDSQNGGTANAVEEIAAYEDISEQKPVADDKAGAASAGQSPLSHASTSENLSFAILGSTSGLVVEYARNQTMLLELLCPIARR